MSEVKRYTDALNRINEEILPFSDCNTCPCPTSACDGQIKAECKLDHEALTIAAEAICRLLSLLK